RRVPGCASELGRRAVPDVLDVLQFIHPVSTMSVVAHIGPPRGASGGPGGYLKQLAAAFDGHGAAADVLLPPCIAVAPVEQARTVSAVTVAAHRIRRALF